MTGPSTHLRLKHRALVETPRSGLALILPVVRGGAGSSLSRCIPTRAPDPLEEESP